jgi:hypothetical protein
VGTERRGFVGTPHPQRHRSKRLLKVGVVRGGEQPDRAPLALLERRTPEPEQVTFVRELAGPQRFAGANVLNVLLGYPCRHVRGHGHEVLHGQGPPRVTGAVVAGNTWGAANLSG